MSRPFTCRKLSPADVAAQLGVGVDKVLTWIKSGELKAMDGSESRANRKQARYLIDVADLAAFEKSRMVRPEPAPEVKRRRRRLAAVKQYV